MKFTTHFELHSQTTRLFETLSYSDRPSAKDGTFTLSDAPFQETWTAAATEHASSNYNSEGNVPSDLKFELFPLHSPLLRESLLVSFPPLTDMLKFSG